MAADELSCGGEVGFYTKYLEYYVKKAESEEVSALLGTAVSSAGERTEEMRWRRRRWRCRRASG